MMSGFKILCSGGFIFTSYLTLVGDDRFYTNCLMPTFRYFIGADSSHELFMKMLRLRMVPFKPYIDPYTLHTIAFGKRLSNPVGIAAGFDKNGEFVTSLYKLGFGFVEVGTITPLAQSGNKIPRIFRLEKDRALINRCGFNNDGMEQVYNNLVVNRNQFGCIGINLGKNVDGSLADYTIGLTRFGAIADYIVINVSSPNTVNLRILQRKHALCKLLLQVIKVRDEMIEKPHIYVKIAPDLCYQDKCDIADVILKLKIDGLIIANTTVERPNTLIDLAQHESGGLSGTPLKQLTTDLIADMYLLTKGKVTIIGVGGISSGQDALDKIRAGASLVQIYTALTFHGPPVVIRIKRELDQLLRAQGFSCVSDAVGADHR